MHIAATDLSTLLESLAAKQPAPGGGAAAAILAGLAAALGEMVVNYSTGKEKLAEHEAVLERALQKLSSARIRALDLATEDAATYEHLSALQRLDSRDPKRRAEWAAAVMRAVAVPRETLELAITVLDECERLCGRSNESLRSDLAIAAVAAEAAASAAAWNVRINLSLIDAEARPSLDNAVSDAVARAAERRRNIEEHCR